MIHISQVLPLTKKYLKSMQPNETVQFKTYKKDRGFLISCLAVDNYRLIEDGYFYASFQGDALSMKSLAKKVLRREFPRSNMVWVDFCQHSEDQNKKIECEQSQLPLF